ncbi:hypothetical protein C3747_124g81 [Trypanosoma cruzi]|uniref:Uncharacterized protein n=1 Tax=Trypanosoma cruzi TaxID=5693 RepID=A0A2V2WB06_TRYCR|nr:hypothetical protein C3747_124g81 [Trypanosoma cruzi]
MVGFYGDDWLINTAALRRAGGLGATPLLKGSSSTEERLRRLSTSYLLCTSVDGVHFYSANFLLRNESQGDVWDSTLFSSLATAVPRESAVPLKNVSRLPLVLRVDPNINGSYYTRDLAVILQLVVRPRLAAVSTNLELETSTESLVRFQRAVAELLHIDPAIVVARLSNRRVVLPLVRKTLRCPLNISLTLCRCHCLRTRECWMAQQKRWGLSRRLQSFSCGTPRCYVIMTPRHPSCRHYYRQLLVRLAL